MKSLWSNVKRIAIASVAIVTVTFVGCSKDDDNDNNRATVYNVSGNASGSQVVPSVTGTGAATITGTYNDSSNVMVYVVNWTNLTAAPTSAAFYTAASGQNGSIIGSNWSLGSTPTVNGTIAAQVTLTEDQESKLKAGNWYYVMSTSNHVSGEVRGQMTASAQ